MNPLFTEITESEATTVVGGASRRSGRFLNQATAGAKADTSTVSDIGFSYADTFTRTLIGDFSASSESYSESTIIYDPAYIPFIGTN